MTTNDLRNAVLAGMVEYAGVAGIMLEEGEELRKNADGTVTLITADEGEHTYDPDQLFGQEILGGVRID